MVTGFAWFDREQWQRLREVADDRNKLDDSFEQWERNASRTFREPQQKGVAIEKVNINVDELVSWCKSRGNPVTSEYRAQYVSIAMRERYGPTEA
jgi:hypothetical protein